MKVLVQLHARRRVTRVRCARDVLTLLTAARLGMTIVAVGLAWIPGVRLQWILGGVQALVELIVAMGERKPAGGGE